MKKSIKKNIKKNTKKKAQAALEILIIFGILVLGSIIFSLFYFNSHKTITTYELDKATKKIENSLSYQKEVKPSSITCGNHLCEPGENCIGCPDDCDCTNCPLTAPTLQITPVPITGVPAGAPGHNTFQLQIQVLRQSPFSGKIIKIKKIIFNEGEGQTDIFYSGLNQIPPTGLEINENMTEDSFGNLSYTISDLSSTKSGNYIFTVFTEVANCEELDTNKQQIVAIKGLSAKLSLSPDGTSDRGEPFGVDITVKNYNSDSNLSITNIYVADTNGDLLDDVCEYDGAKITSSGINNVNLLLTKTYDDYNYSFKKNLSCENPGQYKFMFTLHDNDENTDYDYNATIEKSIEDRCLYLGNVGNGTEEDPYVISNPDDLDCVRYNLSKHFILGDNIDLNHTTLSSNDQYYWYDDTKGWNPIGTLDAAFTGSLDGAGYKITNLYSRRNSPNPGGGVVTPFLITGDIYNSLFLYINNGSVYDLNISEVDLGGITYEAYTAAPLAAYAINSKFTEINVSGVIYSTDLTGGLVSYAKDSNFESISFDGKINLGSFYGGGIIGAAENITLNNSHVVADINGLNFVGGLIGGSSLSLATPNIISNSYSIVNIGGRYNDSYALPASDIGGLVGGGQFIILNSFSDVNIVNAYVDFGGLCGSCNSIINSYATGNIIVDQNTVGGMSGSQLPNYLPLNVGGLAGSLSGAAINSYFVGNITLTPVSKISTPSPTTFVGWATNIGGLVGVVSSQTLETGVANCYSRANITIDGNVNRIGGLIGILNARDVNDSYYTGNLNISGISNTHIGGLIGKKEDTSVVNYSYWNTQTSGYSSSAGGLGRTTTQMTYPYDSNTYVGWDFENVWAIDPTINDGYPYLLPPAPSGGLRGEPALKGVEEGGELFPYVLISEDGEILDSGIINN